MYFCSINYFFCVRTKQPSPEPLHKRDVVMKHEASSNGKWSGTSNSHEHVGFSALSPKSPDYDDDAEEDDKSEPMDRRCTIFLLRKMFSFSVF